MHEQALNRLTFTGEVVETFDHKDECLVKVVCKPEFIILTINKSEHLKLGELVVIDGSFQIKAIHEVKKRGI
ncbi:MAG: hypothetical protein ABFS35_20680 [Bacteroidota bacterium]